MSNVQDKSRLPQVPQSEIDLATLGIGEVAYVREISNGEVESMIGQKVPGDAGQLYCVYMADGTPMSVTDSHEAALASAFEHDLAAISVH